MNFGTWMRFFYLDPGLRTNVGHHANTCRVITSELRRRGVEIFVAGSTRVDPELQAELGAAPFFKFYTYRMGRRNPDATWTGWETEFFHGVETTVEDLEKLPDTTAQDVVFLNSAMPAQLVSIASWLNAMPAGRRPRVVVEFGVDAGLDVRQERGQFTFGIREPQNDPRSFLFSYAAQSIPEDLRKNLFLTTFDRVSSQGYEFITGIKTGVLPFPQMAWAPLTKRSGKRPIVVGILGHQRSEKGYQYLPEIIPILLERHADIQIFVHNAAPAEMAGVQQAVHALASTHARIILDERAANDGLWRQLLLGVDIVLCPYSPVRVAASYSALSVEALANGLPVVAPAGTFLSRFAEHVGAIVTFDKWEAGSIADATSVAITAYDNLADKALAAANGWNQRDRKSLLVDHILGVRPS